MGDLSALRRLERECFGGDAWPLVDLIGVLLFPGIVRLKAEVPSNDGGEMAGFVAGDPKPSERVGWIATLGVSSQYRRRGIATALLDACEEALHMPVVRLSVRRSNNGAAALYYGRGYHMVGVWSRYYFDGEDALVLEKQLPRPKGNESHDETLGR